MFTPSRDDVRAFFLGTWQKYQISLRLSDLEKIALEVILKHPEYHIDLQPDSLQKDYAPESVNPFLHMSLHLTIAEQLTINQPYPIRDLYITLCQKTQDAHIAEHLMMDGLIEMLWQSSRNRTTPDVNIYLNTVRKLLDYPLEKEQTDKNPTT